MRSLTFSLLACALIANAAHAAGSDTSTSPSNAGELPDASINLSAVSVAAGIGYLWGDGNIVYQGERHRFELSGISIVDVGGAHISATGLVYNLRHLRDFGGRYTSVSLGVTVGGGGSVAVLRNEHGVVIKLHSTTRGLKFNISADGVDITLKSKSRRSGTKPIVIK